MINSIIVCGLGAIGSNVLNQLAKMYPDISYIGIDFDVVEKRNIGTQAYFLENVGQPKALAMNVMLRRFNPKINYKGIVTKVAIPEDMYGLFEDPRSTILLDCFDNAASRKVLKQCISTHVYHMGFSTQYTAELMWNKDYSVSGDVDPANSDICTMTDAAAFIHFVCNFGVMQVAEFMRTETQSKHIVFGKWNIRKI